MLMGQIKSVLMPALCKVIPCMPFMVFVRLLML